MRQGRKPEFHVDTVKKRKNILEKLYKEQSVIKKGAFYRQITRDNRPFVCACKMLLLIFDLLLFI